MTRTVRHGGRSGGKTERDRIAAKARKLVADPTIMAEWRACWCRVFDRLQDVYAARRPAMKSFEAHHASEAAREAMLRALVDGKPAAECEAIAFASVTTEAERKMNSVQLRVDMQRSAI